jgi:hypothetical protein
MTTRLVLTRFHSAAGTSPGNTLATGTWWPHPTIRCKLCKVRFNIRHVSIYNRSTKKNIYPVFQQVPFSPGQSTLGTVVYKIVEPILYYYYFIRRLKLAYAHRAVNPSDHSADPTGHVPWRPPPWAHATRYTAGPPSLGPAKNYQGPTGGRKGEFTDAPAAGPIPWQMGTNRLAPGR